jgi:hypothetical protein
MTISFHTTKPIKSHIFIELGFLLHTNPCRRNARYLRSANSWNTFPSSAYMQYILSWHSQWQSYSFNCPLPHGTTAPGRLGSPCCQSFTITLRHTTLARTPLDEWSARRRELHLTTHSTHNRQTSMPPAGFEPTISSSERPKTHALDRTAFNFTYVFTSDYAFISPLTLLHYHTATTTSTLPLQSFFFSQKIFLVSHSIPTLPSIQVQH